MHDPRITRWEKILADQGHPPAHAWVFRDDLVWNPPWHMFHVILDDAEANRWLAEGLLDCRDASAFGVAFELLGSTKRTSYCTIFVPRDERESELLMMPDGV